MALPHSLKTADQGFKSSLLFSIFKEENKIVSILCYNGLGKI